MLASEFATAHDIAITWKYKETTIMGGWEHKRWTTYVTYNGRTETFPYRTGMAIDAPTVGDVLYALASDCRLYEEFANDVEVADNFGMELDSARDMYDACNETASTLSDLFPADYEEFLTVEDE